MKWWDKIVAHFNRGYEEEDLELEWEASTIEDWDWDSLMKDRSLLKMQDEIERKKFVRGCAEQIKNASQKLDEVLLLPRTKWLHSAVSRMMLRKLLQAMTAVSVLTSSTISRKATSLKHSLPRNTEIKVNLWLDTEKTEYRKI